MERASRTRWTIAIASLVSLALLILFMSWLRPGVPKSVTILSGVEGSRSHAWAERYAAFVEDHGVRVEVVPTAGSLEVLRRLRNGADAPTIGFAQSGIESALPETEAPTDLHSLGSLYFEPIWLLVPSGSGIDDIPDLLGKRVSWGERGSDARAAVLTLLRAYDFTPPSAEHELDGLTPAEAAEALVSGQLDAAFFAGTSTDAAVVRLLGDERIHLVSAKHAEVFQRTHPDLGYLFIPQGLFDLGEMIPREDARVVAPAINLVAREGLHPALVDLFLDAANAFHRAGTLLSKRGEFPSEDYTSLPMNSDAAHYYDKGPSGFRKYLPFWLASLVDQLIIFGLPFFVVLSTVFKGIPVAVEWKTKLDLVKLYKRLVLIENAPDRQAKLEDYLAKLDGLEAESAKLHMPALHLTHYFEFRQYIHDMRERMERGW